MLHMHPSQTSLPRSISTDIERGREVWRVCCLIYFYNNAIPFQTGLQYSNLISLHEKNTYYDFRLELFPFQYMSLLCIREVFPDSNKYLYIITKKASHTSFKCEGGFYILCQVKQPILIKLLRTIYIHSPYQITIS